MANQKEASTNPQQPRDLELIGSRGPKTPEPTPTTPAPPTPGPKPDKGDRL